MPSRNSRKLYLEDCFYHIYNRGVEKRIIFLDNQDHSVFLSYLKDYLTPKDTQALYSALSNPSTTRAEKDRILKLLKLNNFSEDITLVAYCLMPNHFHLLIKQKNVGSMDKFMNSLGTRYTMYFNRKYDRVGSLYQDVYKAVEVRTDEQLLYLTRYIHLQSLTVQGDVLHTVHPSSYLNYVGRKHTDWVHPEIILSYFSESHPALTYQSFINVPTDSNDISSLILED